MRGASGGVSWGRSLLAGVAVSLASTCFLGAVIGTWLQRSTLENDVWEDRVGSLGEDPAIQRALSKWATEELLEVVDLDRLEARGLVDADGRPTGELATYIDEPLDQFLATEVDAFVASEAFATSWRVSTTEAHEEVVKTLRGQRDEVTSDGGQVQVDFQPMLQELLAEVADAVPGLVGDGTIDGDAIEAALANVPTGDIDPAVVRQRIEELAATDLPEDWGTVTVYDEGKLALAQDVVRWVDRVPALLWGLTLGLSGLAVLVAPRRLRVVSQLAFGFFLACVGVVLTANLLQDVAMSGITDDTSQEAGLAVFSTLVRPLSQGATILGVVTLVVFVAAVVGGQVRSGSGSGSGSGSTPVTA